MRTAGKHTLAIVARFATLTALAAPVRITMTWTLLRGAPAAKFTSLFGVHYAMLPNLCIEGCVSRVELAQDPTANVGVAWLVGVVRTATKLAPIAMLAKAVTVIALAAPVRVIMTWTVSRGAPAAKLASLLVFSVS